MFKIRNLKVAEAKTKKKVLSTIKEVPNKIVTAIVHYNMNLCIYKELLHRDYTL